MLDWITRNCVQIIYEVWLCRLIQIKGEQMGSSCTFSARAPLLSSLSKNPGNSWVVSKTMRRPIIQLLSTTDAMRSSSARSRSHKSQGNWLCAEIVHTLLMVFEHERQAYHGLVNPVSHLLSVYSFLLQSKTMNAYFDYSVELVGAILQQTNWLDTTRVLRFCD